MYLFSVSCVIFLLFVLTPKSSIAYEKNVSSQGMTPAKLFTNYLKVPWINLNSLWEDEVSSSCRDDITTLFESANAGEIWALQMLDAASKIPAGIFTGNIRDLGMYEECIRVRSDGNLANIQGRHCMVSLSMPPKYVGDASTALDIQKLSPYNPTPDVDLNFAASLCLPSSCGVQDILGLVNASIKGTPELVAFEVEVAQATCSSVGASTDDLTWGTILVISFFGLVASILVFCTACDFVVKVKSKNASLALETLAKFSLYTNAIKLWSTKTPLGTMPAIHGVKFFSVCFVVMVHRFMSTLAIPLVNLGSVYELRESLMATSLLLSPLAVDTFFVINGFLTAYFFLTKMRSGVKFTITELYLHRYLRLTPCIAALLLFVIFILPLLGSGPLWETILGVTTDFCRKNWWTNLLYVQNFVNREQMCMPHTWYSAVEMQLFWLCPIILYPLFHRPKLGVVILSMFLVASLIVPAVYLVANQYSFLIYVNKTFKTKFEEFMYSYTPTYNRASPYFVGLLLGYFVQNKHSGLNKAQATFLWFLTCVFIVFCAWNTYFVQPVAIVYSAAWEAVYVSIGRFAWSLAVAWILYACTQGYGGPVTKFLSLPIFVPLSRMSYGIFLVSAVIQVGLSATQQTAEFGSRIGVLYLVWGDLATSIAGALVLNLFFESPVIVLEKILKTKGISETIEDPLTGKKEKLAAIIKQCPNSANTHINSDSDIQDKMLQPDFWRTVSDVLNAAGRRSTKTPVEWVKTWQDWKTITSNNYNQCKTCENNTGNDTAQVETGMITLEKELLIFLAAVSWGSNDVAKSKEAVVAGPAQSHPDYYSPRKDDEFVGLPTLDLQPFPGAMRKFGGPSAAENYSSVYE